MHFWRITTLLTTLLIFFFVTPLVTKTFAATADTCLPIYNGGDSCRQDPNLGIDLMVQDPAFQRYVDTLNSNQTKYAPGQLVLFKIVVTNKDTKKELKNVTVTNIAPNYLTFNSGNGKYDGATKTINWTIDTMHPNEERVLYVQATVDKTIPNAGACVVDRAVVTSDKMISQDNAGFCIDKQSVLGTRTNPSTSKGGLPIYQPTQTRKTPDTGPEALALFGLIPAGGIGFWLRKKATL